MIQPDGVENAGSDAAEAAVDQGSSAGAMLRAAREAYGVQLAALAASLKVAPAKLEALERDDWAALPDIVFARGLASAACRALGLEAAPILAKLPQSRVQSLMAAKQPLQAKMPQSRVARLDTSASRPTWYWLGLVGVLLLAAVLALFYPQLQDWWSAHTVAAASEPVAPEATAPVAPAPVAVVPADGAATPAATAAPQDLALTTALAPAPAAAPLKVRVTQDTWVQVKEIKGKVVFEKTLKAGQEQEITGTPPWRVVIGNAKGGVEVQVHGEPLDLAAIVGKGTIARFEVK
ncbi:hypothetical protein GCM10027082_27900 [Comamonas humi]